jgi:hypothetical protein
MRQLKYHHRFESSAEVNATPELLSAELDDHERLSAHMMQSSAMMAGSKMRFDFDEDGGRAVGSKIRMSGQILGIPLELEEVITERDPPKHKAWETIGTPRLLVIGGYRMGFDIEPRGNGARLTVFIDYNEPKSPWTIVGRLFGPVYARWCTVNMTQGAAREFAS